VNTGFGRDEAEDAAEGSFSTLSERVLRGQLPSDAREALTQTRINHEAINVMSMY
jgi:hypothetical protein